MKYKIITVVLILFMALGGIIFSTFYNNELSYVYHQHLEDSKDESKCLNIPNCSHLPIVNIKTNNKVIPIQSKELNNNDTDYIIGDVLVYDRGNKVNYLGGNAEKTSARIHYRGRSSIKFDKKGYSIKFVNDKDEKISKTFLGMPSDSDWVLNGPFIDKTLIRNYMWYNISGEIMGEAPKVRFLELYLDDTYQGVYLAVEAVTQKDNGRVKMEKLKKDSIATSYLIQSDADLGTDVTNLNSFAKYTYKSTNLINFVIKYPKEEDMNAEIKKYIYDDFNKFEKMLYSFDYKDYEKYIDVDSFVDYFIINEFTQNYDAGYLSTYIYKDVAGKYKMYVWDFNSANNNFEFDFLEEQYFEFVKNLWYEMLIRDPEFVDAIIRRYKNLRKSYLSEKYLYKYIDDTVLYLGDAIDRNFSIWGYTFDKNYNDFPAFYMPEDHDDAVRQLKEAIHLRGEWMDKNIDNLRFYSHESKNKKFNK